MNLANPTYLKALLSRHGFNFSKSLGQNFLIDEGVLDKIVESAGIDKNSCVLEIGAGAGTLTQRLSERAGKVVSLEIDSALIPILNETMKEAENFKLIHGDILKTDISVLVHEEFGGQDFSVVANLPYYITTPIVMSLLESDLPCRLMTLMVQKEVAERMNASPGGKDYGALTVAVQYHADVSIICRAEPHCFIPQPKVASTVVSLNISEKPKVKVSDEKLMFALVKSAFGQRRKTLLNALSNSPHLSLDKEKIAAAMRDAGLESKVRGEKLSVENFAHLTDMLTEKS